MTKVVVITGASAGVGRATARAFAEAGYDVGLLARGRAGLEAAAKEVEATGRRAAILEADVADAAAVDAAATRVEDELGPVDVWVNSAMTTVFAPVWEVAPDELERATKVTYLGQVHGTMAALARMRPRDRGHIVSVGSALAFVGIPLQSAYCASKFAVRGFMESVRAELLAEGSHVQVSMVHLPAVNTPQFDWCLSRMAHQARPVAPIYQPEVAARAILRAAEDVRREKVVGSWNQGLVLFAKAFPSVVAHYAARTAIDGQQTNEPQGHDRPADLWEPVDAEEDWGAHGRFDDDSHGVLTPAFLKQLPETVVHVAASFGATALEKLRRRSSVTR